MRFLSGVMGAPAFGDDDARQFSGSSDRADPVGSRLQPTDPARTAAVEAEPSRTRRDQDDHLIQTLYGVTLELEGAAEDVAAAPDAARARIETAIDRLAEVMSGVRRTMTGPEA